jgi:hypothetical protein
LTARESGKLGPVIQAGNDSVDGMSLPGRPLPQSDSVLICNEGRYFRRQEGPMKKFKGLGTVLLAGFLVIPGNLGLAGQVLAQSDVKTTEDKQLQELRQKRLEQREEREREAKQLENTGQRKQDAVKRQQDAGQRQKAAEQRMRELDAEDK